MGQKLEEKLINEILKKRDQNIGIQFITDTRLDLEEAREVEVIKNTTLNSISHKPKATFLRT